MSLLTFKGGVHPNDGKALAKDKAIVQVQPKGDLVYPMSQHIGAPAVPIVAKGDHVLRGQMIAEAGGFVSAPIYASVSGTVKFIEPRFTPAGSKAVSYTHLDRHLSSSQVNCSRRRSWDQLQWRPILICHWCRLFSHRL